MQQMPNYQAKVFKIKANMQKLSKLMQDLNTRTDQLRMQREKHELEKAADRALKVARERELIASEPV